MHTVEVDRERPDCRVFIDLLYGHGRNVDTEGNSIPVYSRAWTEFFIKDRESDAPSVEIYATKDEPSVFAVVSESAHSEELAALYLYLASGKSISCQGVELVNVSLLTDKYSTELRRGVNAVWHKSSQELPYPSLA